MQVHIDGVDYEIPDEDVRAHIAELDGEAAEGNKYIFGIHVNHTRELGPMGDDIAQFMEKVGGGVVEVQVSVNAKLNEFKDKVMGFTANRQLEPAIGDAQPTEYDEYDHEEEEE